MIDRSFTALQHGKEIGESCPHWLDFDIYDHLPAGMKERYYRQCTQPKVIYRANDDSWFIRCIYCEDGKACECRHDFPKLTELVKREYDDSTDDD